MAPHSVPESASPSSTNVPLFADKHVKFVAGFAKVREKAGGRGEEEEVLKPMFLLIRSTFSLSTSSLDFFGEKKKTSQDRTTFEAVATDHLRLSGVYWGLATLALLGKLEEGGPGLDRGEVAAFVSSCAREGAEGVASKFSKNGNENENPKPRSVGFGGAERHDAHLLYTLSAVQVASLIDRMDLIDADAVMNCEKTSLSNFFSKLSSGLSLFPPLSPLFPLHFSLFSCSSFFL